MGEFKNLHKFVFEANNYKELKKFFGWENEPNLYRKDIYDFCYIEDLNERRIRDAETLALICANAKLDNILEIGTSSGAATLLIHKNTPTSSIYTLNVLPEEILSGNAGNYTTIAIEKEKIGKVYREDGAQNIIQVYENSQTWEPTIDSLDLIFIDGCHDEDYVYKDTLKYLPFLKSGGFVLWHDFNIHLVKKHEWINDVCKSIERLIQEGHIVGNLLQIKDSWTLIYRKP